MLYAQEAFTHSKDIYEWDILPSAVRVKGRYSLSDIQQALSDPDSGLPVIGIPVEFSMDEIQYGNMFSKQYEQCLVLKNGQHPDDYFHFVFTVRWTGNTTTIQIYRSGISPLSQKSNLRDMRKNSDSLFQNLLGAVTKTDEQGISQEYDYYAIVADIIKTTFGI